ncbi:MAG: hypothetical protein RBU30_00325 [Polyangia bacterium]|jgi:hypothetical protein|nr:hypothetical protein [Polyangia bacterium]
MSEAASHLALAVVAARRIRHWRRKGPLAAFILSLACALAAAHGDARAGDPRIKWRTLKTPHFEITFDLQHLEIARRTATVCEGVHRLLSPFMRHRPRGRVRVLLTDYTDGANGWAMVIPRNVVNVFLSAPDSLSTLNDYDDWLVGLILHEYTHILHLDTIGGISRLINWIFGKTASPNHLQPSWWLEGFAIFNESRFSSGGRNRNSLYDMYLRMAVLEGKEQSVGEISSAPVRFPHGSTPYLYGARFFKYLADRFGADRMVRISHDYGDEWIPYGFNKVAARHLEGKGYVELYKDWIAHLRKTYGMQKRAVERRGLREGTRLTFSGDYTDWPRFHPTEGWLLFADDDGKSDYAWKRLPATRGKLAGKPRKLLRLEGGGSPSFDADGAKFVYHQYEVHRAVYDFCDLFEYDLRAKRRRRLTEGRRLREPDVSPDGRSIVAVQNGPGASHLVLVPRRGLGRQDAPRVLVRSKPHEQVATPRFSPDGSHLAYIGWHRGGRRDLYLLEVATGRTRRLTSDRAQEVTPEFSPDGAWIYFSSDRTGIYNIYALHLATGSLKQVTNVLGGALYPAVSQDGRRLAYVGFTHRGHDLYVMELDPTRFLPALPYLEDRNPPRTMDAKPSEAKVSRYNPLASLYPESWWMTASLTPGGESVTLLLSGSDLAEQHYWDLSTSYYVPSQGFFFGASYGYSGLWPSLGLSASYSQSPRGGLKLDGRPETFVEENLRMDASVSLPVLRSRRFGSASLRFTYRLQRFAPAQATESPPDPGASLTSAPERGLLSGATMAISYSRIFGYRYSVSPERGRSLSLSMGYYDPALGSDYRILSASWSWTEYLPMPWLANHVLAIRLAGGFSRGNLQRRGFYSVGGLPYQDLLQAIIDAAPIGGAYLRGYPAGAQWGDQYYLLNIEYRLPLVWLNWAPWTLPLYFRRLSAAVFADLGTAFFGDFDRETIRVGVGAELLLDLVIGHYQWMTLRFGYAYGLEEPGGHQYYFLFGVPFG